MHSKSGSLTRFDIEEMILDTLLMFSPVLYAFMDYIESGQPVDWTALGYLAIGIVFATVRRTLKDYEKAHNK